MDINECTKCGLIQPLENMKTDGRAKSGYKSPAICLDCHKESRRAKQRITQKARRDTNGHTEWYRNYMRLRNYQMTAEQFDIWLLSQNGCCAVCGSDSPGERHWALDHDHSCCSTTPTCGNCTRGLLCHKCNRMLGLANDNIEILQSAIQYLIKPPTYTPPDIESILYG